MIDAVYVLIGRYTVGTKGEICNEYQYDRTAGGSIYGNGVPLSE